MALSLILPMVDFCTYSHHTNTIESILEARNTQYTTETNTTLNFSPKVWEVNPFALLMQYTIFALSAKYCA